MKDFRYYMNKTFDIILMCYFWLRLGGTALLWFIAFWSNNLYDYLTAFDNPYITAFMVYFSPLGLIIEIVLIVGIINMLDKKDT